MAKHLSQQEVIKLLSCSPVTGRIKCCKSILYSLTKCIQIKVGQAKNKACKPQQRTSLQKISK